MFSQTWTQMLQIPRLFLYLNKHDYAKKKNQWINNLHVHTDTEYSKQESAVYLESKHLTLLWKEHVFPSSKQLKKFHCSSKLISPEIFTSFQNWKLGKMCANFVNKYNIAF
jgi:hypothetical protein